MLSPYLFWKYITASDHKKSVSKPIILGQGTANRGHDPKQFLQVLDYDTVRKFTAFSTLEFCS